MSEVEVVRENETGDGWSLTVRVGVGARDSLHTVALSWADHDHLTRGSASPAATAAAVVRAALAAHGGALPERIDTAREMRRVEGFADRVRARLGESAG